MKEKLEINEEDINLERARGLVLKMIKSWPGIKRGDLEGVKEETRDILAMMNSPQLSTYIEGEKRAFYDALQERLDKGVNASAYFADLVAFGREVLNIRYPN